MRKKGEGTFIRLNVVGSFLFDLFKSDQPGASRIYRSKVPKYLVFCVCIERRFQLAPLSYFTLWWRSQGSCKFQRPYVPFGTWRSLWVCLPPYKMRPTWANKDKPSYQNRHQRPFLGRGVFHFLSCLRGKLETIFVLKAGAILKVPKREAILRLPADSNKSLSWKGRSFKISKYDGKFKLLTKPKTKLFATNFALVPWN